MIAAPLARLDQATRMLAEAKTLDDVLAVRDLAEAARQAARAIRLGLDAQNHAAVKLGRPIIGFDIDPDCIESSTRRLMAEGLVS